MIGQTNYNEAAKRLADEARRAAGTEYKAGQIASGLGQIGSSAYRTNFDVNARDVGRQQQMANLQGLQRDIQGGGSLAQMMFESQARQAASQSGRQVGQSVREAGASPAAALAASRQAQENLLTPALQNAQIARTQYDLAANQQRAGIGSQLFAAEDERARINAQNDMAGYFKGREQNIGAMGAAGGLYGDIYKGQLGAAATNQGNASDLIRNQTNADVATRGQDIEIGKAVAGATSSAIGAMFSDKRMKHSIGDASDEIDDVLDQVEPKSYKYNDEKNGKGIQIGQMAQDLQKTPLRNIVEDTPEGKTVDYGKALGFMLASQARLNERLDAMEGRR